MRSILGKLAIATLALTMFGAITVAPARAADASISFVGVLAPGCTSSIQVGWSITVPDVAHTYEVIVYNPRTGTSSGTGIFTVGISGNLGFNSALSVPAGSMAGDIYIITANIYHPVTLALDDTMSITVDCATGLPPLPPVAVGVCLIDDGRINAESCAGPVALYCDDTGLEVWNIDPDTGEGSLAFTIDGNFPMPVSNALLKKVGDVELWHLTSGEFQVNADQGEGKTYAFVFNGCPYDGAGYNANIDPNE